MQLERFVMLNLFAHLVADWIMEAQRDKPSLETYLYGNSTSSWTPKQTISRAFLSSVHPSRAAGCRTDILS